MLVLIIIKPCTHYNYPHLHRSFFPGNPDPTQIEEKSAQKLFYATERVGEALMFELQPQTAYKLATAIILPYCPICLVNFILLPCFYSLLFLLNYFIVCEATLSTKKSAI